MPFDEDAPFQGPDGAPNHKPYSKAMARALNGLIKPGGDGDPPSAFYTANDFVLTADLETILDGISNVDTAPPPLTIGFNWTGAVTTGALGSKYWPITGTETWVNLYAYALLYVDGLTDDIVLNFEYKGNDVLSTPLTIPAAQPAGSAVVSTAFALATLAPSGSLDLFRFVRAKVVSADPADSNAQILQVLACQRDTTA